MITEIREVLERYKEHIPMVAMAELLAVIDGAEEKQIPKEVKLYIGNDMSCPSCSHRLRGYEGIRNPYCKYCGQQLER